MQDQDYELHKLAGEVAKALGWAWTVKYTYPWCVHLKHSVGDATLSFRFTQGSHSKVEIASAYPQTRKYKVQHFSIKVSVERGSAAIAKEIHRRLMPDYTTELNEVLKYNQQEKLDDQSRVSTAILLAKLLPGATYQDQPGAWNTEVYYYPPTGGRVTVNVNHDGSEASIDTGHLPIGTVIRILKAMTSE